jgi:hypothetical protein
MYMEIKGPGTGKTRLKGKDRVAGLTLADFKTNMKPQQSRLWCGVRKSTQNEGSGQNSGRQSVNTISWLFKGLPSQQRVLHIFLEKK